MLTVVGALGLVASLTLAAVFAAAGIAKLADLAGTRTATREFGAPESLARALALLIPVVELTVAILLLFGTTRAVGAVGALVLLCAFSAAIAASLARGRTPDCHCFGQLHSAPASWKTLVRNGVLAVLAATAMAAGLGGEVPSAIAWARGLDGAEVVALTLGTVLLVVIAIGTLGFLSLMRSHGRTLLRLDTIERGLADAGIELELREALPELGHEPGTAAPAFATTDVNGRPVSLDDLLAPGLPLLLLFTTPSCGHCQALLPAVAAWQVEHADRLTIALADDSDREVSLAKAQEHGLERVLVDDELAIHTAYGAGGTPSAVLVAPDATIASHVAQGADSIDQLLDQVLARGADRADEGLPVGSPVTDLRLTTLDGEPVSVVSTKEETLLLFWNPGCGFCSSMRDDLLAWEQHPPDGAPRLVIVSSGDEASTRAEGFSSAVALDPDFTVGVTFDAGGTPTAVLLDREGRVASRLAAGAEAVFALAGGHGLVDARADVGVAVRAQL